MKNNFTKWLVFIVGIVCILAGMTSCLLNNVAGGGIVIAAGIVLLLLSHFEIEYFKMPGLEAKLAKTIVEAEVTLEALRKIIIPIAENSVSLAARTGRMDTASSHKELYNISMRIKKELMEIKVSDEDINRVLHSWYFFTAFEMGSQIIEVLCQRLRVKEKELNEIVKKWQGDKPVSDYKRYEELLIPLRMVSQEINSVRKCLWKKDYQDIPNIIENYIRVNITLAEQEKVELWGEINEQWLDLIHFVNNRELRRKEQWFATELL
ncbi:hypothetical protein ABIE06_001577 [Pantoea dispersa]|uniref:hypothetical protein n=1 Tax=Pantoea dispersa TaxID=59814 RepID=UPI003D1B25A1